MSFTVMTSKDNLAVKKWEIDTWLQALQTTALGHMMERGAIYVPEELKGAAPGDAVTFAYAGKLERVPIGEGGTLDGNEESLELNNHQMVMNVSRLGVLNPNTDTIEQKRTYVNFEGTAKKLIQRRVAELVDQSLFNQLAGSNPTTATYGGTNYTNATDLLQVQGLNTPTAPTTNRWILAGGASNEQSLTSSNTFTTDLIDYALEASSLSIQPIDMLDDMTFDLFISPEQMVDLFHDTTGHIQWYTNALAMMKRTADNPIEKRFSNNLVCAGKYRNVNIYESPRVAWGQNSGSSAVITTVRRAVLVGRDAVSFQSPWGSTLDDDDVPVKFFAQLKDYDYYKGLEGRMIYGCKKMSPSNKEDIGVTVISSYAATHSIASVQPAT